MLLLFLDGMFLFTYTLNMIVHTVMYSYYFVSLFTKSIDKIIAVKKSITIMQMVSNFSIFLCCMVLWGKFIN